MFRPMMIRQVTGAIALVVLLAARTANASDTGSLPVPTIFAPGSISGLANDGTPTFSPDGRTLYINHYATTWGVILESHRIAGGWSKPVVAPFSGPSFDVQPVFSPDGRTLVYASKRALPARSGTPPRYAFNLWRVARTPSGWSAPVRLPDTVNRFHNMHNPSLAANGDIYFTAPATSRPGAAPRWRLFEATYRDDGRYDRAHPIAFAGGEAFDAEEPCIAPDESYFIFASRGLRAPVGHKHFFIAVRKGMSWGKPVAIRYAGDGWPDGGDDDAEPEIGPDGAMLYFNSSRSVPIDPNRTRAQF